MPAGFLLLCPRRSSARGPEAQDPGDGGDEKKKRESRRSGFLNLIKPRSKPERPPTVLMADEPSSPKGAGRGPAVDMARRDARPAEHNDSAERTEEMLTPEPPEDGEDGGRPEPSDGRGSPQGSRRYGVQVMGSGLLAEMKAKQGRRVAGAHKVRPTDLRLWALSPRVRAAAPGRPLVVPVVGGPCRG